jgi:hypothetical protein
VYYFLHTLLVKMDIPISQEEMSTWIDRLILEVDHLETQQQEQLEDRAPQQEPQQEPQQQLQDPMQLQPNRWNTSVSVKSQTGLGNQMRNEWRYFTDIQMAHIWIKDQTRRSPSNWTIATFFETCDAMDREWRLSPTSEFVVAYSENTRYILKYEPSVSFESVMAFNNPNANTQYQSVQY